MIGAVGFGLGLGAAAAACITAFGLRRFGLRRGKRSDPDRLRYYSVRKPLLGGLAVAFGFWIGIFVFIVTRDSPWADSLYPEASARALFASLFWGTTFLVLSSSLADWRQDSGYYEWLYVLASAAFISVNHLGIQKLSVPFLGVVELGVVSGAILTVLWVGIVVSVVEVLESIGGAVTLAPVILASLYFAFVSPEGETVQPVMAVALVGALLGMMPCQWVRDGIVLGKAGNKVVGFLFAALTLVGRRKSGTALLILPVAVCILYVVVDSLTRIEKRGRHET